jgi:hypothetical protein
MGADAVPVDHRMASEGLKEGIMPERYMFAYTDAGLSLGKSLAASLEKHGFTCAFTVEEHAHFKLHVLTATRPTAGKLNGGEL